MRSPLKRFVHRYLFAAPFWGVVFYGGVFGAATAAAQFDDRAKDFVSNQITMWVAIRDAKFVISWLIFFGLIWLAVFLWSWEWHKEYEPIESKLPDSRESESATPPHAVIQPDSANHAHIAGEVNATLADATLSATGSVSLHGLYVGNIIASAGSLRDEHRLDLAIIGFNGSEVGVSVASLTGRIRGGSGNFRDMEELPAPALSAPVEVEAGKEFIIGLQQHLPPKLATQFLNDIEKSHLTLDLQSLEVSAVSMLDQNRKTALPLWHAVTLKRRDDVVSNRVTVLSATGVAAGFATANAFGEATLKMQLNRAEGSTEDQ